MLDCIYIVHASIPDGGNALSNMKKHGSKGMSEMLWFGISRFNVFFGTSAKQSKTRSSLIVKRFISRKWKKNMTQFMYWQWNPVSFNLMPGGSDSEWEGYGSTRRTVTITEIQYCFNVHWASLEGSKAQKVLSLNWRIVVAGSNFIFLCVGLFFFPSFFISCITLTEAESE